MSSWASDTQGLELESETVYDVFVAFRKGQELVPALLYTGWVDKDGETRGAYIVQDSKIRHVYEIDGAPDTLLVRGKADRDAISKAGLISRLNSLYESLQTLGGTASLDLDALHQAIKRLA